MIVHHLLFHLSHNRCCFVLCFVLWFLLVVGLEIATLLDLTSGNVFITSLGQHHHLTF